MDASGLKPITGNHLDSPFVFVTRRDPVPTVVFDSYWRFAAERQNIFMKRVVGHPSPWTTNSVLLEYKFTNAYRASDRVSQYLIQKVIYGEVFDLRDTVFRILLFKLFNKVETWESLEAYCGPLVADNFDVDECDRLLSSALRRGAAIYSAAYIMPSGPVSIRRERKHRMHLELVADLLNGDFLKKLATTATMQEAYGILRTIPSIGPFLAFQYITDFNYSDHFSFSEMEFVVPGPGARDGIRKCFSDLGDYTEADVIRWVADRQHQEFEDRALSFQSLWGRDLQLIDCQNLFCEVDKYARVVHPDATGRTGRTRIKQKFAPSESSLPNPWFPPKWGINQAVANDLVPSSRTPGKLLA
jgi:hypothetical protein